MPRPYSRNGNASDIRRLERSVPFARNRRGEACLARRNPAHRLIPFRFTRLSRAKYCLLPRTTEVHHAVRVASAAPGSERLAGRAARLRRGGGGAGLPLPLGERPRDRAATAHV